MQATHLESCPLFAGLGRHALVEIAGAFVPETWSRRNQIMGPADVTERFRIVTTGRVKITRSNSRDGHELIVWLLGPGDGFDIVSLLDGEPHAVSAWALDDVTILSAPMPVVRQWLERFAPLRLAMHRYAARKLRELTELASDLALHDTSARLARLLLRHIDTRRRSDKPCIDPLLDLPQDELASMIGSVRVVVSRILADLKREGIVSVQDGTLRIESLKRLLRRADDHGHAARRRARSSRAALG